MELNQLIHFMHDKKKEFEIAVSREAKKLSLGDVTKEIDLDTWLFVNKNWEDRQKLEFHLCQHHYSAIVDKDTLILRGNYDIEIARFVGDEVEKYYENLSAKILKAKQKYLDNLPF